MRKIQMVDLARQYEDIQEEIIDYFMQADTDDVNVAYKKLKAEDIELREIELVRLKFLSDVAN